MGKSLLHKIIGALRPGGGTTVDLQEQFRQFQGVLEGNNRALEAMTEMGEKLGGDYLFDAQYTQGAYAALFTAISSSLGHFNLLTRDQYPELRAILARIDGLVQRMLHTAGPLSGRLVVPYPEITWDQAEEVGGKNFQLAVMGNRLGLRVPAAFAITTSACAAFLAHNHLNTRLANMSDADAAAFAALRSAILAGEFPADLRVAISEAVAWLHGRLGRGSTLAVRSSAEEEDGEFSFAGQFQTMLNVPCEAQAVLDAYKQVVASLFQDNAVAYQRRLGLDPGRLRMAVGCVAMIDARASGVIYTVAANGDRDKLVVSAAWGLGTAVVDGLVEADLYTVAKGEEPRILDRRIGNKARMVVRRDTAGIAMVDTPAAQRLLPCLSDAEVLDLARQAVIIETHRKTPQDIEWAIDAKGSSFILQARALRVEEADAATAPGPVQAPAGHPVLLRDQGTVVQRGTTAGKVFILGQISELDQIPKGSILVASHDSPNFVQVMPFLNGIITDVGVPTSHMASICREFNIPTVVNTGMATTRLANGQEITLQASEGSTFTVYDGIVQELLREERQTTGRLRELYEFRRQKYVMRYIAPLNLVNPLQEEFVPEKCQTIHDLIRFMHEKAVQTLVANAAKGGRGLGRLFGRDRALRRLRLPIPIQLVVIDLGGGLAGRSGAREVTVEQVSSLPLRAVLAGMMQPGVWQNTGLALRGADLLAGMTRAVDLAGDSGLAGANVALASKDYVNMSLRFGYHFNMLDCYCSDKPRNNHIFFRFVGGAANIANRSRRIQLMAAVLAASGFVLSSKGDLLVGRLSGHSRTEMEEILQQIGRLIAYTRQLDAILDSDDKVAELTRNFLAGDYRVGM